MRKSRFPLAVQKIYAKIVFILKQHLLSQRRKGRKENQILIAIAKPTNQVKDKSQNI
jgi:hypothetical protein